MLQICFPLTLEHGKSCFRANKNKAEYVCVIRWWMLWWWNISVKINRLKIAGNLYISSRTHLYDAIGYNLKQYWMSITTSNLWRKKTNSQFFVGNKLIDFVLAPNDNSPRKRFLAVNKRFCLDFMELWLQSAHNRWKHLIRTG